MLKELDILFSITFLNVDLDQKSYFKFSSRISLLRFYSYKYTIRIHSLKIRNVFLLYLSLLCIIGYEDIKKKYCLIESKTVLLMHWMEIYCRNCGPMFYSR